MKRGKSHYGSYPVALRHALILLLPLITFVTLPSSADVVLVRGTSSAPNTAERNYAKSISRNLERRLDAMGVACTAIDDEAVNAASLRGAKVVILGYNPSPPRGEIDALRDFVEGGGKLVVFYSSSPELAALMGMRLGKYAAASRWGQWSAMRFNASAPAHAPGRVRQVSNNIRPAHPKTNGSKIIAVWEDADGKPTGDPAWVQSDRGFWMSHVLLDDGDTWNKNLMLASMLGCHDPDVWKAMALRGLELPFAGRFRTVEEMEADIVRTAGRGGAARNVAALLGQMTPLRRTAREFHRQGRFAESVEYSRRAWELLETAYGTAQPSVPGEFRGVWDHAGTGLRPGAWDETCRTLAASGITDLFVNMMGTVKAHYATDVLDESDTFRLYGDQLASCLAAARRHGLRVHVWKLCWRIDNAPARMMARFRKAGRLQVSDSGRSLAWLCPSNPENLRREKDAIREAVRRYAVDGVHLDYIRYPDSHSCYCPGCRAAFEASLGRALSRWPQDVRSGMLVRSFRQWRADRITALVRDVSAFARRMRPGIRISAAVYGRYPLCADSVGQDWGEWLKQGYVDFVCPMDYTSDLERFRDYVSSQTALPMSGGRIFPGIGVTAAESRLNSLQVIDQIAVLRREGARGFVLFDLNHTLVDETLPILRLGVTAPQQIGE